MEVAVVCGGGDGNGGLCGGGFWVRCPLVRWCCPVGCWFCDTGYAPGNREDLNKLPRFSIDYESLREQLQSRYVVISGGEPLYHQDFEELLERLVGDDLEVAVETSGAKAFPFEKFPQVWVTFSPKFHATDYLKEQLNQTFWTHSREIKVVISDANALEAFVQQLSNETDEDHLDRLNKRLDEIILFCLVLVR